FSRGTSLGATFITPQSLAAQRQAVETERADRAAKLLSDNAAEAAKAQAEMEDYIATERQTIQTLRASGRDVDARAADALEESLEDYISRSHPTFFDKARKEYL